MVRYASGVNGERASYHPSNERWEEVIREGAADMGK